MKTWRRITYEGVTYRWLVEDRQTQEGADTFTRSIIIQAEDTPSSRAIFVSDVLGRLRLYNGSSHPLTVRSGLVRACIRYALQHGWDPVGRAADFRFDLTSELLSQINGSDDEPGQKP